MKPAGNHHRKRKQRPRESDDLPSPAPENSMDPTDGGGATLDAAAGDICAQLMQRYSSSSAPQHRHLIATAAAMKSVLLEDSVPLSPLSYFAAVITALSQPAQNDAASSAALATLLSIVVPMVPEGAIKAEKAREGVGILVEVLEDGKSATSTAKCVVKCLGVLLGLCDLEDWGSVELPFRTLLRWSCDKRPKVRKCAVVYLENVLKSFQSGNSKKKASKLILSLLESNMPLADELGALENVDGSESEKQSDAEHSDVVHVLSIIRVAMPYLSDKIRLEVVRKLMQLLRTRSSGLARLILGSIEAFLDKVEVETTNQLVEDLVDGLSSYLSSDNIPKDSVISTANLLKMALDKIHCRDVGKSSKSLTLGLNAVIGLLTRESDIALQSSNILKYLIDHHLSEIESHPVSDDPTKDSESDAIECMCLSFLRLLDGCVGVPCEHILGVVSVLFLKLGRNSAFYMDNIVLKLAEIFIRATGDEHKTCHLQKCLGSAVVAMGADYILKLIPISFNVEKMTCSNLWLLPILKKYTTGASLAYFMEHIVPLAESLERTSHKVKKSVLRRDLVAYAHGLWGLLPAFCRGSTDVSQNFQSFGKLLLARLEKDTSYEDIVDALQELVKQNKPSSKASDASEPRKLSSDLLEDCLMEKRSMCCHSVKIAKKNIKAMSLYSNELLQALITLFLNSPPEKRSSLRKAITCLASISDSSMTKKIIISSLESFPQVKALADCGEHDISDASADDAHFDSGSKIDDSQLCLILELASSVVEGAEEVLVNLIFKLAKRALQTGEGTVISEAYKTLSCVLEGHPSYCSSKMDELVDLLTGLKSPDDVGSLNDRLSTLQILLVHGLKSVADAEYKMPFLILNEIILALKDSKEEARKTAYDVLLRIGSSLGGSSNDNADGAYNRLISMILGYLSGPSPRITSAAVSALSVLVFKEPELCLIVPDVVPSVTSLLQTKAVEVIKAALGFIKVLVSCLESKDLQNFVSVIVDGILPWSSVSRHHFKSKVTVIFEILIRKCGFPTIKLATPERYHPFVKKISMSRHGKAASSEADSTDGKQQVAAVSESRQKKRLRDEKGSESGSVLHRNKRRYQKQDPHSSPPGKAAWGSHEKTNRFGGGHNKSRMGDGPRNPNAMKRDKFGRKQAPHSSGASPGSSGWGSNEKTNRFRGKSKMSRRDDGPRKSMAMKGGRFGGAPGKHRKGGGGKNKMEG